ncbi:uncharacterized protein LOC108229115 isoform X2 [Kryptolebias marmoratus]|uniref:uncharacterized protein LOC108229115 isoform X2 n=1 Tax=Kryptolebias marmoratus TaxID=37003 RepID=UPI0018ACA7C9|nr:uncharacterized protein LOC108229115 isoform X2 [Kryptolebias marmoratus]
MSVQAEFSPVSSSFPVMLIVRSIVGVILIIVLILLWRYRESKDFCCIRPKQSESFTTNHGVNQSDGHEYSFPLQDFTPIYSEINHQKKAKKKKKERSSSRSSSLF